ncbi:MAG: hypothetical protein AAF958_05530 [Planctomycetota bacterium]
MGKDESLDFYSFFNKYSLLDDYGFFAGILVRVFRKLLPAVPPPNTFEFQLLAGDGSVDEVLARLQSDASLRRATQLQLDQSIQVLGAKIIAYGADADMKAKFDRLGLDDSPFDRLFADLSGLDRDESLSDLSASLAALENLVTELRKKKSKIGTTLHLTFVTRRLLEYTDRMGVLIDLRRNFASRVHWQRVINDFVDFSKNKNRITHFVKRHTDLLALGIVEHTSQKGEKYIARSQGEYGNFFARSLLGGVIIALFAFVKLWLDSRGFGDGIGGVLFGLNYAACFIIVTAVGGLIATKQPAHTASTIAEAIDRRNDLCLDSDDCVKGLVRSVFRSQFVSIVGNFVAALSVAALLGFLLGGIGREDLFGIIKPDDLSEIIKPDDLSEIIKPDDLMKKVVPSISLVFFAMVAGVFLALAGLIAGYIDNTVLAREIPYRIQHSALFCRSEKLAKFVKKQAGGIVGNLVLGMLLGTAFLLSHLSPIAVDIRHIAFSSANIGYAVAEGDFDAKRFLLAVCGALLIGVTNLVVSFSITLSLALKSRGVSLSRLPRLLSP